MVNRFYLSGTFFSVIYKNYSYDWQLAGAYSTKTGKMGCFYYQDVAQFFYWLFLSLSFLFFWLGLIRKLADKIIFRISKNEAISGLISALIYTLVIVVGIMISLNILRLDKAVTSSCRCGNYRLILGFAFQDLTANFISGAFIIL